MYKKILSISLVFIILCLAFYCPVYAANKHVLTNDQLNAWLKQYNGDMNAVINEVHNTPEYQDFPVTVKKAVDMYLDICSGANSSSIESIKEIILFSPSAATSSSTGKTSTKAGQDEVWIAAEGLYDTFKSLGFMFCCLYFLIDLIDKTTKEQLNPEHFMRQFIKLLVAILIIENGLTLIGYFFDLTSGLIDSIGSNTNTQSIDFTMLDAVAEYANQKNWILGTLVGIGEMTTLLVPSIASLIAKAIITIQCWSRFIEISIRVVFAPIGMADMFSDGLHGTGFRYLKKLLSVLLQGVMIIAIVALCQKIQAAMSVSSSVFFQVSQIVVAFTEVGLIKKSQVFANDLLGVH